MFDRLTDPAKRILAGARPVSATVGVGTRFGTAGAAEGAGFHPVSGEDRRD